MPVTGLMSETLQVLHRSVIGQDDAGVELVEYLPGEVVACFVGRQGAEEDLSGRDQVSAMWTFLVDVGGAISPYDRLLYNGETFEVIGHPEDAVRPDAGVAFTRVVARFTEG